jgi:hypothetical protein
MRSSVTLLTFFKCSGGMCCSLHRPLRFRMISPGRAGLSDPAYVSDVAIRCTASGRSTMFHPDAPPPGPRLSDASLPRKIATGNLCANGCLGICSARVRRELGRFCVSRPCAFGERSKRGSRLVASGLPRRAKARLRDSAHGRDGGQASRQRRLPQCRRA